MKNILILLGILIFAGCQNPTAPAPPEQMASQIKTAKTGVHSETDTARMLDSLFVLDSMSMMDNGFPVTGDWRPIESIKAIKDERVRLLTAWIESDKIMDARGVANDEWENKFVPRYAVLGAISGAILERYNIYLDDDNNDANNNMIRAWLKNPVPFPLDPDIDGE